MTFVKKYSTLLLFAFILISCESTDPWEFVPPDFSSVPARFDISGIEPTEIDEGVTAYIIEGSDSSPFFVTRRDIAIVKVTLRTVEGDIIFSRSEEHTSELQSRGHLVCRLLLEKKK